MPTPPAPPADHVDAELERVRRVFPPLRAAALAYRPNWDGDQLRDAMTAAHIAGWPLERIYATVYKLTCDPDAEPRDLAEAAKRPTCRWPAGDPREGAARARELLGQRHPDPATESVPST